MQIEPNLRQTKPKIIAADYGIFLIESNLLNCDCLLIFWNFKSKNSADEICFIQIGDYFAGQRSGVIALCALSTKVRINYFAHTDGFETYFRFLSHSPSNLTQTLHIMM